MQKKMATSSILWPRLVFYIESQTHAIEWQVFCILAPHSKDFSNARTTWSLILFSSKYSML